MIIHHIVYSFFDIVIVDHSVSINDKLVGERCINKILISSGREAVIVYNIKYNLACKRSG